MKKIAFLFLILLSFGAQAQQRAIPEFWGHYVYDEAHVLSTATVDKLEAILKAHADSTSNQVAVLIIPSLETEILEEYALRVAHDAWKLGQANNDNGVLLLIAVDDRQMRIEAGDGLQGVLTDAVSNRIIRNDIAPRFRENDYDGGVTAGVEGIIRAIGNEYTADNAESEEMTWKERLLIGAFVFGILGIFTVLGLFVPGCAGWFMYAFLIPFYATFPLFILGTNGGLAALGLYAIGFPIAKVVLGRTAWGKRLMEKMGNSRKGGGGGSMGGGWTSAGGWFSGGSSGGGWSSGGGGGFSGGGGSFSGGGSSGSW